MLTQIHRLKGWMILLPDSFDMCNTSWVTIFPYMIKAGKNSEILKYFRDSYVCFVMSG